MLSLYKDKLVLLMLALLFAAPLVAIFSVPM